MGEDRTPAGLRARLEVVGRGIRATFTERAASLDRAAERLDAGEQTAREEIRRLAHMLRGVAANADRPELGDRAGRLEEAAKGAAADMAIAEGARRLARALERATEERIAAAAPAAAPRESAGAPAARPGLGWKVVALDDEASTRRLLAITLTHAGGCEAHITERPAEAMALVEQLRPDLVIVDAMMPDVDGLAFYRGVRHRVGATVPVVILSAASAEELGWELPDDPRLRWMQKPFRPGALLDALRAFVEG